MALNDEEIERVIIKYFTDHLGTTGNGFDGLAEEYLLKVCPLALYVDENNLNLEKIKRIMKDKMDIEKSYSKVPKKGETVMSFRKKKSYYNITALEKRIQKEINNQ